MTVNTGATGQMAYYSGANAISGTSNLYVSGSNIGIGSATPTATLTVNGASAFQFGTDYSTTGTQSDVSLGSASSVRYTGSGVATFNGISGGVNGRVLYLHNGSTSALTLADKASADTTYANQIVTGTGSNLSVASNSAVILQYDASATNSNGASGAWRVIGGSGSGGSGTTATGIGTSGYLPVWTGTSTLSNSTLYQSGSNVGVGTASPQSVLQVNGEVQIGSSGASCTAANAGAIRYKSSLIQFCNGSGWYTLAASSYASGSNFLVFITTTGSGTWTVPAASHPFRLKRLAAVEMAMQAITTSAVAAVAGERTQKVRTLRSLPVVRRITTLAQ